MRSPQLARVALALIFVPAALIGLTATIVPHSFYDDFPFVTHWVDLLPPYNEHLVTDVGGLYLGFAVMIAWAAATLERTLVQAVCAAWLLTATLHLIFHATHLDNFDTGDAIAEIVNLALLLVPPPIALWAVADARPRQPA
jgi:hypothetical protein